MSHPPTADLLKQVFPTARVSRLDYLRWLYDESPFGPVIETNLDDAEGRAGHYALVPIDLSVDRTIVRAGLSVNTAVHERARGGGVFVRLASETFEQARANELHHVVGVANANSTPGFVRRLGFELVMPLPATVLVPLPGRPRALRSGPATPDAFRDGGLAANAEDLLAPPSRGIGRVWTTETLRWRLAAPGSRYALHRSEEMLAVTTVDARRAVRVAVILAVFAAHTLDAASLRALVRTVCRYHRAPVALHVGVNERASFAGIPLPKRLRESPLNLIHRNLVGAGRPGPFARFEFLDFDAY